MNVLSSKISKKAGQSIIRKLLTYLFTHVNEEQHPNLSAALEAIVKLGIPIEAFEDITTEHLIAKYVQETIIRLSKDLHNFYEIINQFVEGLIVTY
jgi:hypothetical protein